MQQEPWRQCLDLLAQTAAGEATPPDPEQFERLIAKIYKQTRKKRRKQAREQSDEKTNAQRRRQSREDRTRNRVEEQALIDTTVMAAIHDGVEESVAGESPGRTARLRPCYTCPKRYDEVHGFYHMLCPDCAALNLEKRRRCEDLHGRVALVTGGRIKIGYQTALKLLRDGARVVVTTRFPRDAAMRYQGEKDFSDWGDRLEIYGLDFTDLPAVLRFADAMNRSLPQLDILINNAAQSVRRLPSFFQKELALERGDLAALPKQARALLGRWEVSEYPAQALEPPILSERERRALAQPPVQDVAVDRHGQPLDRRQEHSWTYSLDEVPPGELVEVLFVNSAAPALLTGRLKPLMERSVYADRYVVNIGGLDGRFESYSKNEKHPHVNMSKAALNMITRTSAQEWVRSGIYMTSVDTGWISHEGPFANLERMASIGFRPPLDEVDGAARTLDPVYQGVAGGERWVGVLLRNYRPSPW